MVLVPFVHVRGGACGSSSGPGEAIAHVGLIFSVNEDPEDVLAAAEAATRTVAQRLDDTCLSVHAGCQRCARQQCARSRWPTCTQCCTGRSTKGKVLNVDAAVARAASRAWLVAPDAEWPLKSPDLAPEGWVCHTGPTGRTYWHHEALGPAPWDPAGTSLPSGEGSLVEELTCPEEASEGWLSYQGADGRRFWHHASLGPAPWEQPPPQDPVVPPPPSCQPDLPLSELPPLRPGISRL